MARTSRFAAVLLSLGAAGIGQLPVGNEVPEIEFHDTWNFAADLVALSETRGAPVLLEFWATWCGPCKAQMPHIGELQAQFADRGLVVLGISNEKRDKVAPFLAPNKMTWPVATAAGSVWQDFGVRGIPHAFLIDRAGKIAWSGHPSALTPELVEPLLADADSPLRRLDGALAPVQDLVDRGQCAKALATLQTMLERGKLDAATTQRAKTALARLERAAALRLARAEDRRGDGELVPAVGLQEVATRYAGAAAGKAANARLAERATRSPTLADLDAAALRLVRGRQLLADGKAGAAATEFTAIADDRDAAVRAAATEALTALAESGRRGFHDDCANCRQAGRTCPEHLPK